MRVKRAVRGLVSELETSNIEGERVGTSVGEIEERVYLRFPHLQRAVKYIMNY